MIENKIDQSGSFPRQKVTYKERTQDWKEQCVDSVIKQCNSFQSKRRSSYKNKRRNYDLFNNKINKADFNHVLNPYAMSPDQLAQGSLPATLQPYDVLSKTFMLLFGEERKRIFSPIVRAINADSILWKEEQKREEMLNLLRNYLIDQEASEEFLEQQLKKYQNYSVKDIKESQAQHMLTFLMKNQRISEAFQEGWKDGLIAGEEIYDAQNIAGAARLRRVNPLEINFILNTNSNLIDDAEKIYEKNRLSISEIIDEFYDILTPEQIDDLECRRDGKDTVYNYDFNDVPIWDYFPDATLLGENIRMINSIDDLDTIVDQRIPVHRVRWKGKRKIGFYHYIDEYNEEQIIQVDEFFKAPKSPDEYVEWFWINEYWEGIRIGSDMYLNIQPRKNQFRSLDNLSECKSGYTGTLYSALNSQSTSLMDRLVPWLYLYLIIWYRTELLIASNQGKIALIDTSLIPDGWEIEKWLYYAGAMKFGFVNAYNEGLKGERKGIINTSTQNKSLDMAQGNEIQFYISTLQFIEQKIQDTTGVTDQRLGAIQTSERVGNTERSVMQSSHITEEYFAVHNYTKIRALETLLKVAQDIVYEKGDKAFLYVNNDMDTISGLIQKDEFTACDLALYISDSHKDQLILDTFVQHLNEALQNDKVDFSMVADIIGSESIADIKNKLKEAEQARIEREQQTQSQQLEVQKQMHDEQMALEYEKLDREDINKQLDREVDLATEQMKALALDEGANPIDIAAIGDQALQQQEINLKHIQERDKLAQQDKELQTNKMLKEKELKIKKEIEDKKIKAIEVQNKSQEKIAKQKAENDQKMMDAKIALEKLKIVAAKSKAAQAKKKKPE